MTELKNESSSSSEDGIEIEVHDTSRSVPPPAIHWKCIRCDKQLEPDSHMGENYVPYPMLHGGVVFRSSGQYGSTVLDCGVGIPFRWNAEVQIVVCDDCMKAQAHRISAGKNGRTILETRASGFVPVEFQDYTTFEELRAVKKRYVEQRDEFTDDMVTMIEGREMIKLRRNKGQ